MDFNINHSVKVKLTERGRDLLRTKHEALYKEVIPKSMVPPYKEPKTDEAGWSEFQLWDLMRIFGPHVYNGCVLPFETIIQITEGQEI